MMQQQLTWLKRALSVCALRCRRWILGMNDEIIRENKQWQGLALC